MYITEIKEVVRRFIIFFMLVCTIVVLCGCEIELERESELARAISNNSFIVTD